MTARVTIVITMPTTLIYREDIEHIFKGPAVRKRTGMLDYFKKGELPDVVRAREIVTATAMSFYAHTSPTRTNQTNPMQFNARRGVATLLVTRIVTAEMIDPLKSDLDRRNDNLMAAVKLLEERKALDRDSCHLFGIDYTFEPNEDV